MKKASWILLALVGALVLMGSVGSLYVAFSGAPDPLGPDGATIQDVAAGRAEILAALQARRATAASFAAAYAVLFLAIVLGPYRRGDAWAWWALLAGALALAVLCLLRIPTLGTRLGAFTGVLPLIGAVVGLVLDVRRLRPPAA